MKRNEYIHTRSRGAGRLLLKSARAIRNSLGCLMIAAVPLVAVAEHHGADDAALRAAIEAFDHAYATNDVETYFGFYADDATVYFYGARQDVSAYHQEWTALMEAGGGVEKNEMSDLQVQLMPSGDVAVATSFIDNRTRYPDGEISTSRAFETDVWLRVDGAWKIISLHFSEIPEPAE